MIAALAVEPLTHDDLASLPRDGAVREIINGALHTGPPPTLAHQGVLLNLPVRFFPAVEAAGGSGVVRFAPVTVTFNPYSVVEPDLVFVRRERWEARFDGGQIVGAPDIVVEVVSPESRSHDRVTKFGLYAGNGVPEYWLVDSEFQNVAMYYLDGERYEAAEPDRDGLLASRVLPGLRFDPAGGFSAAGSRG